MSIKERVAKSYKSTILRRRKQLKDVQPPSTYDVYTSNMTSRAMRQTFMLSHPQPKRRSDDDPPLKPKDLQMPCNLNNPLQDYSLRLATQHTAQNPFRVKQMRVSSVLKD